MKYKCQAHVSVCAPLSSTVRPRTPLVPRLTAVLRDVALLFVATFLGGFLVAIALGEANRGTPLWSISMTLVSAVVCITAFLAFAHLADTNRFVHVGFVAILSSMLSWIYFAYRGDLTFLTAVGPLALMVAYASAGAGLSYALRRSPRSVGPSVV